MIWIAIVGIAVALLYFFLTKKSRANLSTLPEQFVVFDDRLSVDDTHRALGDCKRTMIDYAAAAAKLGSAH